MNIDPIVLLAYVSIALNIITMVAACIAYAIFHVRKRRRKRDVHAAPGRADGPAAPVFLRRHPMPGAKSPASSSEPMTTAPEETRSPALAEFR